jgi:hypothetical protein
VQLNFNHELEVGTFVKDKLFKVGDSKGRPEARDGALGTTPADRGRAESETAFQAASRENHGLLLQNVRANAFDGKEWEW